MSQVYYVKLIYWKVSSLIFEDFVVERIHTFMFIQTHKNNKDKFWIPQDVDHELTYPETVDYA